MHRSDATESVPSLPRILLATEPYKSSALRNSPTPQECWFFGEHRLSCEASQIGRFRAVVGKAGLEELLRAIKPHEFARVTVDTTVRDKANTHPVDSRLLEIARHKMCQRRKTEG